MKQSVINQLSGVVFSTSEISLVRSIIVDQTFEQTLSLVTALTLFESNGSTPLADNLQSERKLLRSHLSVYFDKFLDGTVKVKGGKRGTDFDNTRDKSATRRNVRRMLNLPSLTDEELAEYELLHGLSSLDSSYSVRLNRVG